MSRGDAESTGGWLVLFSGGQDSGTCLAWACAEAARRGGRVETVGFAYGQRHAVEMECRTRLRQDIANRDLSWLKCLGDDHVLDLAVLGELSDTALTREADIAARADGLPNTFVPGRNLAFLVFAAALAVRRGLGVLVGGMCQEDFSGYPDCRRSVLDTQMEAIRAGMAVDLELETPLMNRTKAQAWKLLETLGGEALVEIVRRESHTCYRGERGQAHAWGYGCGACPACELRARGWRDYRGL